ncbi:MAG TPA: hypothetical protein VK470_20125, partial [Bacteroidota bacterium]|nr:hypothetical protein [Bacteroidota bacterium]
EVTTPYLSAYAVYTMLEAKHHGYRVDTRSLENGLGYLTRVLSGEEPDAHYNREASQCTQALIVYTLARAGKTDYGAIDKLFSERATLPLFAKAFVMRAAALNNQNSPIVTELARDFTNRVKIDATGAAFEEPNENGLWWIFHSNTRTTAVILQALVESNKDADLSSKIVRRLLNVQRNGRWRTTQENLFVVAALASYFKKYEHEEPNFRAEIALDGKKILSEAFKGRSLETKKAMEPLARIAKGKPVRVTLDKQGPGRLYYGIRLNYTPHASETPRSEGLTLLRSMEPVEGASEKAVRLGQMMKVTVSVIAHQDRQYVAVEDPVPAGFEIVATNFATSASNLSEGESGGEYFNIFNHTERYDDRMTLFADSMPAGIHSYVYLVCAIHAGTYTQPSTRAECMYEPEIFGRTESGTVTIH